MICPFGFVAAAIFLGPQAVEKLGNQPLVVRAAVFVTVVVVLGYLINLALMFFS